MIDLRPDDRVLVLDLPDTGILREYARVLTRGLLVGLGDAEQVAEARRALADLDNVMFVNAGPDNIPWQDGFFTAVIALTRDASQEVRRVLTPGGRMLTLQL